MNFNFTEEQAMIKDSVARFIADDYDFDQRTKNVAMEHGFNPSSWQTFAELGWLSIPFQAPSVALVAVPLISW